MKEPSFKIFDFYKFDKGQVSLSMFAVIEKYSDDFTEFYIGFNLFKVSISIGRMMR